MNRQLYSLLDNRDNLDSINIGTIEDWLIKEPFNQVLYLLMRRKMPEYIENEFSFGVHNTLTPFFFEPDFLIANQKGGNCEIEDFPQKIIESSFEKSVVNVSVNNDDTETMPVISPDSNLTKFTENHIRMGGGQPGQEIPENMNSNEVQDDSNKKEKSKKKKNNILQMTGGNSFSEWLQNQKPIYSKHKKKKKNADPVAISVKKSITPSDEIISEPLAKILYNQGHYLDAKLMYKKLAIKFPESADKYLNEINGINEKLSHGS